MIKFPGGDSVDVASVNSRLEVATEAPVPSSGRKLFPPDFRECGVRAIFFPPCSVC